MKADLKGVVLDVGRVVHCLCKALQCPRCLRLPRGCRERVVAECLSAVPGAEQDLVLLAIDSRVADRACRCNTI